MRSESGSRNWQRKITGKVMDLLRPWLGRRGFRAHGTHARAWGIARLLRGLFAEGLEAAPAMANARKRKLVRGGGRTRVMMDTFESRVLMNAIVIITDTNWSAITTGSGAGGQPSALDTITVTNGSTDLTVNVSNAVVGSILVNNTNGSSSTTRLIFNANSALNVVNSLTVQGTSRPAAVEMVNGGTLTLGGTFTIGSNGSFTAGAGTVIYAGAGAQTVTLTSYNNLAITGSRGGATVTLPSGSIAIAGSFNPAATNVVYAKTGNTIDYTTGAQTITAFNYNNLTISGSRATNDVTLASGTIGVASTLTLSATFTGAGNYVNTGNTIDYNGTGAQTVVTSGNGSFAYNNLTISGTHAGNVTFSSTGTIGIMGAFNPNASFSSGSYVRTGSTIAYTGTGAQTVTAFTYNNLTIGGSGTKTAGGAIVVPNTFTISSGATFDAATFTHSFGGAFTNAGTFIGSSSTADFNGAGSQALTLSGGTTNFWQMTISSNTSKTVTGNPITVLDDLTLSAGTLVLGAVGLSVGGDLANGGVITSTGTVSLNGAGNQLVSGNNITLGTLLVGGSGTKTLDVALTMTNLTVNAGAELNLGTDAHSVSSAFSNAGTVTGGTSTMSFNGGSAQAITSTGTTTLNVVSLSSSTKTFSGSFTVNGNFSIASSTTMSGSLYHVLVKGNFTNSGTAAVGSGTVTLGASGNQTMSGTTTFGRLIISGSGTKSLSSGDLTASAVNVDAGTTLNLGAAANDLTVNGNLVIDGTLIMNGQLAVTGNFTNNGTFTPNSGTVTMGGAAAQTVGGSTTTTFSNLRISNSSTGIILNTNASVTGTLTFVNGDITTGSNRLTVSGSVSGAAAGTGFVVGNLSKPVTTGAVKTFEVGSDGFYNPLMVNFASVTTPGNLIVSTTGTDHPNLLSSGISPAQSLNRYYTLASDGSFAFAGSYTAAMTYVAAEREFGTSPTNPRMGVFSGGSWVQVATATANGTNATASGLTSMGDLALGQLNRTLSTDNVAVTINEDTASTVITLDVTDPDADGVVTIASLPANGTLHQWLTGGNPGTQITTVGTLVTDASHRVVFIPAANGNGSPYATFTFTANDGFTAASTSTVNVNVTPVNDAPTLAGSENVAGINEDVAAASNTGTLVSDLIAGHVTDIDSGALSGIAVIGAVNTNGTWQYTINGGTNWVAFGTPSVTTARLLAADALTRVRFVPNANFAGAVANGLTFRAWDQTSGGSNGGTASTSSNGGTTAFSTATASTSITVTAINDAPVRTAGAPVAINVAEDSNNVTAVTLGLTSLAYGPGGNSDESGQTLTYTVTVIPSHIAVFLADGTTQVNAGTVVTLTQLQGLRYKTVANANGAGSLTWTVQDSGGTTNGGLDTLTENLSVTVTAVNDAPVLTATAPAFPGLNEDPASSPGTSVATFISGLTVSDVDSATIGLAITAVNNNSIGTWQYSVNSGGAWSTLTGSSGSSLLLTNSASNLIRFVPNANANGTATFSYRAWDQSSGANNTIANTGTNGGSTPYSATQDTSTITVAAVNDAPVVTATVAALSYTENATTAVDTGLTVTDIDSANLTGATVGISAGFVTGQDVLGFTNQNGITGSYDGGTGILTLSGTASVANYQAALRSVTYTNTSDNPNTAARTVSFAVTDGSLSSNTATRNITLTAVNDAPVLTAVHNLTAIDEDDVTSSGTLVSALFDATDAESTALGVAVTAADNVNGAWQYSTNGGTNWAAFGAVNATSARLLAADAQTRVRFVPTANYHGSATLTVRAWDMSSGTAGGTANASAGGGSSAFSGTTGQPSITVNSVNDAPVGTNGSVRIVKNTPHVFAAANFGFTDPSDSPANAFAAVHITTLATNGALERFDGADWIAVQAGDVLTVAELDAGHLRFMPDTDETGTPYATFTFQVQDNGGGADLDTTPRTFTVSVNIAPVIDSVTITPASPTTNQTVTANVTSHDDDGETPTYTYQWQLNGVDISGETGATLNLATTGNGNKGQSITVRVTPHDVTEAGAAVTSSAVVVANSAPSATSVSISPSSPTTNQTLTAVVTGWSDADGDLEGYTYVWELNGNAIAGQTGSTLDLSVVGHGDKNDVIRVIATPFDGTASGTALTSAAVTVQNSAPSATSVSISPTNPTTNQTLTATVTGWSDADGDLEGYTYVWQLNGNMIAGQTGSTLDLSVVGNGNKGDQIRVIATPFDGTSAGTPLTSAAVTIQNSTPSATSVSLSPSSPTTNQTVTATVTGWADADNDPEGYTYVWEVNDVVIAGQTGNALDLSVTGHGNRGDVIRVTATPFDGTASGAAVTTTATVANSAPAIVSVSISPASPNTSDTLTANVTSSDADNNTVTYSYVWLKNNVVISGETGSTLNLSVVGNGDPGDSIVVRVTPNDGTVSGAAVDSSAVLVASSGPVIGGVETAALQYLENGAPAAVSSTLTLTEPNSLDIASATVTIQGYVSGQDVLAFTDQNGISGNFDTNTGVLTLSGTASAALYQAALRSVTYSNTSESPNEGARTLVFVANNGADNSLPASRGLTVLSVNDAPSGTDNAFTLDEDGSHTFTAAEFGFSDATDAPANSLAGVVITSLPTAGSLLLNGSAVSAGQEIAVADINGGLLTYAPVANQNGAPYATMTFQVRDSGGILNGGVDLDPSANTFTFNVTALNDAPVVGTVGSLDAIDEDNFSSTGTLVSAIMAGGVTDVDAGATLGIAVTAVNNTNGTWQYQLDGETTWQNFGTPSDGDARLLAADARIRFVPAANFHGTASMSFRGWDMTSGTAGATAIITAVGGDTAYSTGVASSSITVNSVNDAPSGADATIALGEDQPHVFTAADFGFSDVNDTPANALASVVIVTVPAAGSLLLNGSAVSAGQEIAVADINSGLLVFTPASNQTGAPYATLTFQVRDDGGTLLSGVDLDPSANTLTINVSGSNDAPVLTGANNFATITEDETDNDGELVSALISGQVSDDDAGALSGIAITETVAGTGSWEYSLDDGATWLDVVVASNASLLLRSTDRVRFVPDAANGGSVSITFRAWDQTAGTAGATMDTSTSNGGSTSVSSATATSNLTVSSLNDAPMLFGTNQLTAIAEDDVANSGTLVSGLISGHVTDADAGAVSGIAVYAVNTSNGTWEYTLNGTTWLSLDAASAGAARLLAADATTRVRFVPAANFTGTVTGGLSYRAWDQTSGTAGGTADVSGNGGTTAFSAATASASVNVVAGPKVLSITRDGPEFTGSKYNFWTITFDQQVSGFETGRNLIDIAIQGSNLDTAPANGIQDVTTSDFIHFTINVYQDNETDVRVVLLDNDSIVSTATGVALGGVGTTGAGNGSFLTGDVVTIDRTGPVVAPIADFAPSSTPVTIPLTSVTDNELQITAVEWFREAQPGPAVRGFALAANDGAFDETTEEVTWAIPAAEWSLIDPGIEYFMVRAQDAAGNWGEFERFDVFKTPTIDSVSTPRVEGTAINVSGSFDYTGPYPLTLSWRIFKGDSLYVTGTGANFSFTPNDSGPYHIEFTATVDDPTHVEGTDPFAQATQDITVGNVAPTLTLSGAASVAENTPYTLTLDSSDIGSDFITTWTVTWGDGSPAQTVPVATPTFNISTGRWESSTQVNHTYADGANNYTISATATDEDGTHAGSNTLPVSVTNTAPQNLTVTPDGGNTNTEGQLLQYTGSATDPAGVNDPLTFTWTVTRDSIAYGSPVSGLNLTAFSFTPDAGGSFVVTLTVTDGDGGSTSLSTAAFTVTGINDAPVRTAGSTNPLTVGEDSANTTPVSLGLGGLTYGPGGGADETGQTLTYTVTGVPAFIQLWKTADLVTFVAVQPNDTLTIAELRSLHYTTIEDATGTGDITWSVQDSGGIDNGGVDTLLQSLSMTVVANESPEITGVSGTLAYVENDAATTVAPSLVVSDVDSTTLVSGTVTVTGFVAGQDELGFTATGNITVQDLGGGVLALSGTDTLANYQSVLRSITYRNTSENPSTGNRMFSFVVSDGIDSSAAVSRTVTVEAVNDAPEILSPAGTLALNEDGTLVFNGVNAISLADVDSQAGALEMSLTVAHGALTLSGVSGLTFSAGDGTADATMTFTGTLASINAALAGMSYAPAANYSGADALAITLSDQGNTGTGGALGDSATVNLNVNAGPTVTAIARTTAALSNAGSVSWTVTFSGAVNGVNAADFALTGAGATAASISSVTPVDAQTYTVVILTGNDGSLGLNLVDDDSIVDTVSGAPLAGVGATGAGNGSFTGEAYLIDRTAPTSTALSANHALISPANDDGTLDDTTFTATITDASAVSWTLTIRDSENAVIRTFTGSGSAVSQTWNGTNGLDEACDDGAYTATLSFGDAAGNPGVSVSTVVTIDNTAPSAPALTGIVTDTGVSGDLTTSDTTLSIAGSAEAGSTVTLLVDGTPVNSLPASGLSEQWPLTVTLTDGLHTISARATDAAGNVSTLSSIQVTIDATVPAAPSTPDLVATSDSGLSDTDNVTNDTTPSFVLTGEAGATVHMFVDGNEVAITQTEGPAGTYQVTVVNALSDGDHTISATLTDLAGNESTASGTLSVRIDTAAPVTDAANHAVAEDGVLNVIAASGVLAGDTDNLDTTGQLRAILTPGGGPLHAANFVLNLDGSFSYEPADNYNGPDSFTYIAVDRAGNESAPRTVTIDVTSVDDAPVLSGMETTSLSYTENGAPLQVTATLTVQDVDSNIASATVTITGYVAGEDGLNVDTTGTNIVADFNAGVMTLTGVDTAANYQAVLRSITYFETGDVPTQSDRVIGIVVRDVTGLDSNTVSRTITVTAVNDAPVILALSTANVNEDGSLAFTGPGTISVSDVDAAGQNLEITLSVLHGVISVGGPAAASITITDTVANINAVIANLVYTPAANYNGPDNLHIALSDLGHSGSGGAQTATHDFAINVISVNDAPSGTDHAVSMLEDGTYTFTLADFGFSDVNDTPADALLEVVLTTVPANGSLTLLGVPVTAGQAVSAAAILAGDLQFAPAADAHGTGYASFTFQVRDNGGGADLDLSANTMTVDVASVNDAPAGADHTVTINEDSTYTFTLADFGFSDVHDGDDFAAVTIHVQLPYSGQLANDGELVTGTTTLTVAEIVAGHLTFTPAANANGAGYMSFTFQVQDDGGILSGGVDTDATANTMTIDVTALNDGPEITSPAGTLAVNEDGTLVFNGLNAVSIADFDVSSDDLQVTLSVAQGALSLSGTTGLSFSAGDGTADSTMTFTGTLAAINTALAGMSYAPALNYSGSDALAISVSDLGHNGTGPVGTDSATVNLSVTPDADTPTLSVTPNSGAEGTPIALVITSSLTDTDGSESLSITISNVPANAMLSAGTDQGGGVWLLTPAQLAGLTITVADQAGFDLTVTATATESGNGDTAVNSQTLHVTVTNANPSLTRLNGSVSVGEGTTLTNSGNYGDVPADTVSLSASEGTLVDNGNGTWSWSLPTNDNVPAHLVTITAQDEDGGLTTVTFTVEATNVAPSATIKGATTADDAPTAGVEGTAISLSSIVTDPAGANDPISYLWTVTKDGNAYTVAGNTSSTFSFTPDDNAVYVVTLTVNDGDAGQTVVTHTITVANANPVPSIDNISLPRQVGTAITANGSATDPAGVNDTVTLAWAVYKDAEIVPFATGGGSNITFTPDEDGSYRVVLTASDEDLGSANVEQTISVQPNATVADRMMFYKDSNFDVLGGHDNAIAIGKVALQLGQTASFLNYSSYDQGINGIMIDFEGSIGTLSASDFEVRVGNDDAPENWLLGPAPTVTQRVISGFTRVELTWAAEDAVKNQWMQVTVKATAATNLAASDVFLFGNAVGEVGDSLADAKVTAVDQIAIRFNNGASIGPFGNFDINRDGLVDNADEVIARTHQTNVFDALRLIAPPASLPLMPGHFTFDITNVGPALSVTPATEPVVTVTTVPLAPVVTAPSVVTAPTVVGAPVTSVAPVVVPTIPAAPAATVASATTSIKPTTLKVTKPTAAQVKAAQAAAKKAAAAQAKKQAAAKKAAAVAVKNPAGKGLTTLLTALLKKRK